MRFTDLPVQVIGIYRFSRSIFRRKKEATIQFAPFQVE